MFTKTRTVQVHVPYMQGTGAACTQISDFMSTNPLRDTQIWPFLKKKSANLHPINYIKNDYYIMIFHVHFWVVVRVRVRLETLK